jgi:hypothetical protein
MSRLDAETREAAREIIEDALVCSQAAMNSALAIFNLTDTDAAYSASDSCAQAIRHLSFAHRQLGKVPVTPND